MTEPVEMWKHKKASERYRAQRFASFLDFYFPGQYDKLARFVEKNWRREKGYESCNRGKISNNLERK